MDLIHLVERLYGTVYMPTTVVEELRHRGAPQAVREWAEHPPGWVLIRNASPVALEEVTRLDRGERDALSLALEMRADRVLMDDRRARVAAAKLGFAVTGTLAILGAAGQLGHLEYDTAIARLLGLGFRASRWDVEYARPQKP